jgi:hypothetical protein
LNQKNQLIFSLQNDSNMIKDKQKKLLVIGAPNTGKTHFGGQLYGRLKTGDNEFTLRETPEDLTIFQDILKKLNNGVPGEHTSMSENRNLILPISTKRGEKLDLIYPDYGGEQITHIVANRKINGKWQEQIESSTDWVLFIRPKLIESIEDITNRFYSHVSKTKETDKTEFNGIKDKSPIFYIELLQMLLFAKKQYVDSNNKPFLLILLSCWDELDLVDTKPKDIFKEKMPLLFDFIQSNWGSNHSILGISATGVSLEKNKPNEEYLIKGPECFGCVIQENGSKDADLTLALKPIIEER